MEISPLSDRSVAEEKEEAFVASTSRRKKRSLVARRAALRPWVIGIGLTVLVAVAAVGAYTLGASIGSWNDRPSTAATPTVHPAPAPSASSEPPMSGGYEIGPDGVLVRPAEFAADTYTKPELPEAAKENSERGAEAAAEHYLALMVYAWNTGDTQPFADMSNETDDFHQNVVTDISNVYAHGWSYDNQSEIVHILQVNPIDPNGSSIPPNTISIAFLTKSSDGITCRGQKVNTSTTEYETVLTLLLTWHDGKWIVTQGTTVNPDA